MTFFGRFSAVSAPRGADRGGCEADVGRWDQTADGCTVRSVSAGAETVRNGPIISDSWKKERKKSNLMRGACSCSALRGALYLSDCWLNGTFIALTGHGETEPTGGFPIGRRDEDPENVLTKRLLDKTGGYITGRIALIDKQCTVTSS